MTVKAATASGVDPASIASRRSLADGAEILVRQRPAGQVYLPHGHREHVLMCTTGRLDARASARSVLRADGRDREWRSRPSGHVSFLPAELPIEWSWTYPSDSIHLTLGPSFFETLGEELGAARTPSPFFRTLSPEVGSLMHTLAEETASGRVGADLITSSILTMIGVRLLRGEAKPRPPRPRRRIAKLPEPMRRRALELISADLDRSLSLAELAESCGFSPYHFARIFKATFGLPPHEYRLQLRIDGARRMMEEDPTRTIAAIANELGFSDESHLRRHFRRIVGTTPRRYRDQHRAPRA